METNSFLCESEKKTHNISYLSKHDFQSCTYFHNAANSFTSIVPLLKYWIEEQFSHMTNLIFHIV